MGATIIVNNMTVVHKKSGGISTAFPDVCKTPTPGGPIPIPYPNIAMSSDTAKGSKKVKMDKEPIMLESSNFKMSTGDEAGSAQGVVSNKIKGKAYPKAYSMDVKVEGKAVFRQLDIMLQNGGSPTNTPPGPEAQAPATASGNKMKGEVVSAEWNATKLKCGDEVVAKVETKDFTDGDAVGVTAISDLNRTVGNWVEPVRGNKCNIPWITRTGPLPPAGGGVKLDLIASGAGGVAIAGTPLELEVPPNAKQDFPLSIRETPMLTYVRPNWLRRAFGAQGTFVQAPGYFGWEYGFELEIKDGYLHVRGRLKLVPGTVANEPRYAPFQHYGTVVITPKWKKFWKRRIEGVWNRRWYEHREACKRGDRCYCWKGCCKFPMKFECEFVNGGHHAEVKIWPGTPCWYQHASPFWWNSGNWCLYRCGHEGNKDGVWAHEWGHNIGQYDEYIGGANKVPFTGSGARGTMQVTGQPATPDVKDSLMGGGLKIKRNHLDEYHDWFRKKAGEAYKPVEF